MAQDQALGVWIQRHPVQWAVVAGVIAAVSVWAGSRLWVVAAFLGIIVFALCAWLWRRDGPANRWLVEYMQQRPQRSAELGATATDVPIGTVGQDEIVKVAVRSIDLDPDPRSLSGDAASFRVTARAMVGPADGPGEESVDIEVVTPEALAAQCASGEIVSGEHMLIVDFSSFDERRVSEWIRQRLEQVEGSTWDEIGERLVRIGHWEFDGYRS